MISSMTGFGRGEVSTNRITANVEVRSVNNRFLEVTSRLPRTLAMRENDIKELVRTKFLRGKVNIIVMLSQENGSEFSLKVNVSAAKAYHRLLKELGKTVKLKEKVTLDHILHFPEVLEMDSLDKDDEEVWVNVQGAIIKALDEANDMRQDEGRELMKDLQKRIEQIDGMIDEIERLASSQIPQQREKLQGRLQELISDASVINNERLELEIALLADKLDVTEECVRFRSHNKFFLEGLKGKESAGRKLNFLTQEMNREANTIGSKTNSAEIAHIVVAIKEELEKIREQLQNIE